MLNLPKMNVLIVAVATIIAGIAGIALVYYLKPKRVKALKAGDYVMFKRKYTLQYPLVPTTHALVVEAIENGKATIVFMTVKSQILKEVVPLECIVRAV